LSLEEVGSVTAVSPETAKSRLRYAVAKLRVSLAPAKESYASGADVIQEPGV
jgi:DNA-directed RNA polymerase specialized sigma24 family protein